MNTDLSIIIVNWNGGDLLRRCVETIVSSEPRVAYEVVIIDNASTDNSVDVARALQARDSRVHLIEHPVNLGHTASFNEGLDWATADYLMIVCADDLLPAIISRLDCVRFH